MAPTRALGLSLLLLSAAAVSEAFGSKVGARYPSGMPVDSKVGARYPSGMPVDTVLTAPWTPFKDEPANGFPLNLDVVPAYMDAVAKTKPNVIWIGGGMAEFYTQSVEERMAYAAAVVPEAKKHGLWSIVHVGTTVQSDAMKMARQAKELGADAIASVPPYYGSAGSVENIVDFFVPIVNASGNMPFLLYWIPGEFPDVHIPSMLEFIDVAIVKMPSFAGVKFVDDQGSQHDYMQCVEKHGHRIGMLWAPEPKLQAAPALGAQGVILAESFYAPTWLRMCHHVLANNFTDAMREQNWKYTADAVFSKHGGTAAKRALYNIMAGVDIGPDRPPHYQPVLTAAQRKALAADLEGVGWFSQHIPGPCLLPSIFPAH
jgi:N-acetylneuraminate lyase